MIDEVKQIIEVGVDFEVENFENEEEEKKIYNVGICGAPPYREPGLSFGG